MRAGSRERGFHISRSTKHRLGGDETGAVNLKVGVVCDDGAVKLGRKTTSDVTTDVRSRCDDRVGSVSTLDKCSDRTRYRNTRKCTCEITGGVHLRRAVLAELSGDRISVATGVDRFNGVRQRACLGEKFKRGRRDLAVIGFGQNPDL